MNNREVLEKVLLKVADGDKRKAAKYVLILDKDLELAEMAHKAQSALEIINLRKALDAQTGYDFYA